MNKYIFENFDIFEIFFTSLVFECETFQAAEVFKLVKKTFKGPEISIPKFPHVVEPKMFPKSSVVHLKKKTTTHFE